MRLRVAIVLSLQQIGIVFLAILLGLVGLLALPRVRQAMVPLTEIVSGKVVYIDPGHGGRDPGCASPSGLAEKDLVLDLSQRLRGLFLRTAIDARLTREDDAEVVSLPTQGWKRPELDNRIRKANEAKADILISIHANSFPEPVWSGAQTFYYPGRDDGKSLALSIQNMLVTKLGPNRRKAKAGDFWILSKAEMPAAMVEVGFLSNPREAALLATEEYRDKVAEAIFEGVIQFLVESRTKRTPPLGEETEHEASSAQPVLRNSGEVVLYFAGPTNQDDCLVAEVRKIPELSQDREPTPQEMLELTLRELIKGPGPGSILYPLLPSDTVIEEIKIDPGGTITVNLGPEVEKSFRGGGHSEELIVYGIVNTVSELCPGRQVYLRIGGQSETSIGGHVWLGRPLNRRDDLICPK